MTAINSVQELYAYWRFHAKPFMTSDAEVEKDLLGFFIKPAWLDEVTESVETATVAVFGPRGMGKTAIRRYVEQEMADKGPILVPYVDFSHMTHEALENEPQFYHFRQIVRLMLAFGLLHRCKMQPEGDTMESLDHDVAKMFHRYFDSENDLGNVIKLNRRDKNESRVSLTDIFTEFLQQEYPWYACRPLRRFARTQWGKISHFIKETVRVWRQVQPELRTPEGREMRRQQVIADFRRLAASAEMFRGESWWLLVDKLDESHERMGDEEGKRRSNVKNLATKLASSLMRDTTIINDTSGVCFKFFLWFDLRKPLLDEDIRLDKLRNWNIAWSNQELGRMVDRRLSHFSNGNIKALGDICIDSDVDSLREIVTKLASGSPRRLVRLMDAVISEHVSYCKNHGVDTKKLTVASSFQGLDECCERLIEEDFDELIVQRLRLLGRKFTVSDISEKLKLQDAISYSDDLVTAGVVRRTGVGQGLKRELEVSESLLLWQIDRKLILEPNMRQPE